MKYLEDFRHTFQLSSEADLSHVKVAVESIYEAYETGINFLGDIDNETNKEGFVIHSQINLIGRIFEQAQGMLVCIATGCPTSAEALARVVVEGSINLMYMAVKGDATTLVAFFDSWLSEHQRKLNEWKLKIIGSENESNIAPMIDTRMRLVEGLVSYLNRLVTACEIERANKTVWPKSLFERFKELRRETDYYESYHRLSGASHISGEDTLTWLITSQMPDEMKQKVSLEAVSFSIMMSRMASKFFVEAVAGCCMMHGFTSMHQFDELGKVLAESVLDIALEAGVPFIQRTD